MISPKTVPSKEDFAVTFTNAIHDGLDKVLGHGATLAVLDHIKVTDNLPNPAEFHQALVDLFGLTGTLSLERAIVQDLTARLKWSKALLEIHDAPDFSAVIHALEEGQSR